MLSNLTSAATILAGLNRFLDERTDLLAYPDLTLPATGTARLQLAIFGARSVARFAGFREVDHDFLFRPKKNISKRNGVTKEDV